ncbi:rhomboid family intramembrane serine protease [Halobacteriales archaeon QS_1_68_20]|nr:MAG: rhomboid family intramembrane serine protease [Halobacteriales archaeon QS_1_68_20]
MDVRPAGRPTVDLLVVFVAVYAFQWLLSILGAPLVASLFVLSAPLSTEPWALVTSVYAHGSISHLLSNAAGLVLFGLIVERVTTRGRFHLFFLTVGALSGVAEITWQGVVGSGAGVVGASGGVLGLLGYVVAGNAIADRTVGRLELGVREQIVVFGAIAVAITFVTTGPQVAVVGHFVGLVLGLIAGRLRLLHAEPRSTEAPATA